MAGRRHSSRGSMRFYVKNLVWSAASRLALHGLYGWEFEEDWIRLERLDMPLPGLGQELHDATLVQISDLHCSPVMREDHLRNYIEIINRMQPHFVVLTGDFITASTRHYARKIGGVLRELSPRVATLACLGNHDYGMWSPRLHGPVRGLAEYLADQLREAGVLCLVNESEAFAVGSAALHIVGVGDLWTDFDPTAAFAAVPGGEPVVALCHNPDAAEQLGAMGANYVLAGHTHGKETAETALTKIAFPLKHRHYSAGRYALKSGGSLYVNRGIASRSSRNGHSPEITVFRLEDPDHARPGETVTHVAAESLLESV